MKFSIKDLFSKCDQIRVASRDHMIKGTCGPGKWRPLNSRHHSVEISACRSFGRGDVMFFLCHVVLREHIMKGTCDLVNVNPLP